MPTVAAGKVMNEIEKESDFRKIATVIRAYKNGYRIHLDFNLPEYW